MNKILVVAVVVIIVGLIVFGTIELLSNKKPSSTDVKDSLANRNTQNQVNYTDKVVNGTTISPRTQQRLSTLRAIQEQNLKVINQANVVKDIEWEEDL
ncbi:hypothetical protein J4218_01590 [Candidatus Pacearchaeota archaeon]|nr:hypothetical protein [Candidatus Pacearchaeota archaeon]